MGFLIGLFDGLLGTSTGGQGGGSGEADDTSYDNSSSGLSATNVQDAIDEVVVNGVNVSYITKDITSLDSPYTLEDNIGFIRVTPNTGNVVVTLTDSSLFTNQRIVKILHYGITNEVHIQTNLSDKIDGYDELRLLSPGAMVQLSTIDNDDWKIEILDGDYTQL